MEKDVEYIALVQIERSMKNEISTFSMSNSRLLEYLNTLKGSPLSPNAVLKAMTMLEKMDRSQRNPKSARAIRHWQNAILEAWGRPFKGMLYESIAFNQPIYPQFEPDEKLLARFRRYPNKLAWMAVIGGAVFLGLLASLLVLVFHWNFWLCFWSGLLIYGLYVAYYFLWFERRLEIRRLKMMTRKMSEPSRQFVRSLPVRNLPLFPDLYDLKEMYAAWKEGKDRARLAREKARQMKEARNLSLNQARALEKQQLQQETRRTSKPSKKASRPNRTMVGRKPGHKVSPVAATRAVRYANASAATQASQNASDAFAPDTLNLDQTGSLSAAERQQILERVEANAMRNEQRRQKSRFDISVDDLPVIDVDLSMFDISLPKPSKSQM